jgi:hypothetical protein
VSQVNALLASYYTTNQVAAFLAGYFPLAGGVWGTGLEVTNLEAIQVDFPTNLFSGTSITLGAPYSISTGSDVNLTGLANVPTSTMRRGVLFIVATSTINVTNPVSWHTSDFVSTRLLTNGNVMVVGIEVQPSLFTNAYVVQMH